MSNYHHRVFVYGSLKRGYGNHWHLKTARFVGETRTLSRKYQMFSLGSFPAVKASGSYAIQGELYEVDDATFKSLDRLESNGSFYQRELVYLEDGSQAWMYLILRPDRYIYRQDGGQRVKNSRNHLQTWLPHESF